jgi:transcription initiation factor TFIID TATA-box-binding protein
LSGKRIVKTCSTSARQKGTKLYLAIQKKYQQSLGKLMEIISTMGSGSIGREIDLETLVSELEHHLGEVIDANFHGPAMVTVRLEDGGPAYTIYRTGTFQIRGAETEDLLSESLRRFKQVFNEINIDTSDIEFEQVTSVFMEDLDREVDLEKLAIELGLEYTEYEPEQFPGLIYRPSKYEVTLLIFATGKIIIGGTVNRQQAIHAVRHLQKEMQLEG